MLKSEDPVKFKSINEQANDIGLFCVKVFNNYVLQKPCLSSVQRLIKPDQLDGKLKEFRDLFNTIRGDSR